MTTLALMRGFGAGLLSMAVLGCASGPVTGRVGMPDGPSAPLSMTWRSGLFGGSGSMSAVMPDGERFSGKYTVISPGVRREELDPEWSGSGGAGAQGQIDDSFWGAARDQVAFQRNYENKAVATLRGDRGTTMLCRFTLLAGGAGMGGGGSGECQTSTGARITAQF
jgi:hypothetical protein